MSTKFLSPGWRMPRNANQSKSSNYSMSFDGSSSEVSMDFTNTGSTGSISVWIKPTDYTTGTQIVWLYVGSGYRDLITLSQRNDGTLSLSAVDNGSTRWAVETDNAVVSNGTWTHVVFSFDGSNGIIYINGSTVSQTYTTTTDKSWWWGNLIPTKLRLGILRVNGYSVQQRYYGQIDAVSIFDYALSSSQVTTLWGGGTSVSNPMALPSPPIAYYPLGTSAYNGEYLAENNAIGDYVFDFDGSNGYVDYGYTALTAISGGSSTLTTSMTISIWFKLNNATSEKGLIYFGDLSNNYGGFTIRHYASKFNFLRGSSHIITGGYSFTDTTSWHNMTLVYDPTNASNCYLYIDGSDTGVTFNASVGNIDFLNSNLSQRSLIIGTYYNTSYIFNGKLSNVQIFDSALSSTEVETLYNYGSPIRTLANIPQSSSLKTWYKLDASEVYNSTTTEWSVDNNQNPSAYPSSLNFNGSSNYIDCGTGSRFNINQITISAWVKLSSGLTSTQIIAGIRNASAGSICYQLQNQASGKFRFVISQSNGTYVDSVANDVHQYNTWYHVLGVADGSNIKLYVNGNLQTIVSSYDGTIYSPNENFNIGRQSSPSNYYWDGELSNVSVFNIGLTSAQVTEIYNNGTPSNLLNHSVTSNLVSWYKLNNTTTGIEDAKGSNNGTNYGATEYTGFVNKLVGDSSGMTQANLVQSDLQTVAPYSKYAMDFDSASSDYIQISYNINLTPQNGNFTISAWINTDNLSGWHPIWCTQNLSSSTIPLVALHTYGNKVRATVGGSTNNPSYSGGWALLLDSTESLTTSTWYHIAVSYNMSGNAQIYINGNTDNSGPIENPQTSWNTGDRFIGEGEGYWDGRISNLSIWNTDLTSSQVTEIYNQGLPGNLNSHSAYSNLISWWQLGENSSFDGNDWIVADEKGTNNGTSVSMPVGALVNGVGTTANGVSSGMSEGNLVGDAPYSTANAISTNMVVTSRVSGVSDAAITTGGTGYVTGTNIATTGGSGTNCTINITTVSGGVITAITINNGGSNYVIGDVLTISGGNGNATITVSGLNTP